MDIEKEIFQRSRANFDKLGKYGFTCNADAFTLSRTFMDGKFRADIFVCEDGKISGTVCDTKTSEEYANLRADAQNDPLVNSVRDSYRQILKEIRFKCFEPAPFISTQANRIAELIYDKYTDTPQFLWKNFPGYAVFTHKEDQRWYALIMDIDRYKLGLGKGRTEIIDIKADTETIDRLIKRKGYYEAYYMDKKIWLTAVLDDTLRDKEIMKLVDASFEMPDPKK